MATHKLKRSANSGASAKSSQQAAGDAVDAQLSRYREMRDFALTSEPSGGSRNRSAKALPFVVQKHAASHLHYDFRLGWNGVLKSWACAKGPSYNTRDRRLAVQVEDHPMEYGGFEGIIPKGQYGGGTVMLWDQGTWAPQPGHEDVDAGLRDGSLKFTLSGSKLHGKWTLVRMNAHHGAEHGRWRDNGKPNWLLIKEHDEFERGADEPAVTEAEPDSATTGRSLEQIAAQQDHTWNSKETNSGGRAWTRQKALPDSGGTSPRAQRAAVKKDAARKAKTERPAGSAIDDILQSLPKETQPTFLKPQLAEEADDPPGGSGWLHELKLDGYRIQARKAGATVKLLTRTGLDWTHRVPSLAIAIKSLPYDQLTLDGEAVVFAADGNTSFAELQASFQDGAQHPLTYVAFDLLHVNGRDARQLPLVERKALLQQIVTSTESDAVRFSEHLTVDGRTMFHRACELHAEGIISKRANAPYRGTRNADWLKSKCLHEQEFVVAGFTLFAGSPKQVGSLLLGYYDDAGQLIYAGRTGTGFTQKLRNELWRKLHSLEQTSSPMLVLPAAAKRGALWVKPEVVAQVRFATWTSENLVRQAAFLGVREDKPAAAVRREGDAPKPKRSRKSAVAESATTPKKPAAGSLPASLRLTHPARVLDASSGVTKQQLAEYYWAVAPHMLPYLQSRPLTLVRCPEGAGKECFYQKHATPPLPAGVKSIAISDKHSGKPEPYITLDSPEALAALAQMSVLECHVWGSTNDDLEHPDRLVFDLDPDEALPWPRVTQAAEQIRERLRQAGMTSFVKTTGGKGLHVVAPIKPSLDWSEIKQLAKLFVERMARDAPALYVTKMTKAARTGRIYLDYLRNERGSTSVSAYSPRARQGMPVSLPLAWSELHANTRPVFPVAEFSLWQPRLKQDPWRRFRAQSADPHALL